MNQNKVRFMVTVKWGYALVYGNILDSRGDFWYKKDYCERIFSKDNHSLNYCPSP